MLESFIDRSKHMSLKEIIEEINDMNRWAYGFKTYKHVLYLEVSRRVYEIINSLEEGELDDEEINSLYTFLIEG